MTVIILFERRRASTTNADFGERDVVEHQHPLGKGRVEDYVPVVGNGQELPAAAEVAQIVGSLVGKTGRRTGEHGAHGLGNYGILEIIDPLDIHQKVLHSAHRQFRENILADHGHCRMTGKLLEGRYGLFVIIRLDVL